MADSQALAAAADLLRSLHRPGTPLVLPNAWDAASARLVEAAGYPVVATTSYAVAAAHGYADDDTMPPDVAFGAVAEAAGAVGVPVTADLEAGYRLAPDELVARLVGAGAVGCNLEDTDHHGSGDLVDAEAQAERLAGVRAAATAAGVPVVINARVDLWLHRGDRPAAELRAEAVRRARLYLDAGADCVYPIFLGDETEIGALVEAVAAPVNIVHRPGAPSPARLAELGVARISLGPGLFRAAQQAVQEALAALPPPPNP